MNRIRLYRAGCPNGFTGDTHCFSSLKQLMEIPEVAACSGLRFKRFSVCRDTPASLMAEYQGTWSVVGTLQHDVPELPTWQYKKLLYAA